MIKTYIKEGDIIVHRNDILYEYNQLTAIIKRNIDGKGIDLRDSLKPNDINDNRLDIFLLKNDKSKYYK